MGCREHKPKTELIRVLRTAEGEILLDNTHRRPGRGVYICRNAECFRRIRKSRAMERNLKAQVPAEVYDRIEAMLAVSAEVPNG